MKRYLVLKAAFELQKPRRGVTIAAIAEHTGIDSKHVSAATQRMLAIGWMTRPTRRNGDERLHRVLVTGAGAAALASGQAAQQRGEARGAVARRGASQRDERVWRAIRVLGKFTAADLVQQIGDAGASEAETARLVYAVTRVVRGLAAAGYLAPLRKESHHRRYLLVDDTGPLPPRVSDARKVVVDPNNGEVRPYRTPGVAGISQETT